MFDGGSIKTLMLSHIPIRQTLKNLLFRLRFQLVGGLIFTILVPLALKQDFALRLSASRDNSIIVGTLALIFSLYIFRRLTVYSSVLGSTFIIPVVTAIYTIAFLSLMFLRLEYSRFLLGMSYALNILWFYGLYYVTVHLKRHCLAIVPNGKAQSLMSIPKANWLPLGDPEVGPKALPEENDAVIADFSADMEAPWQRYLAQCALLGIPVFDYRQVRETLTGKVRIANISENTLGTLTTNIFYIKLKFLVDFVFAVLALIFLTPILVLSAVLIKMDSRGPVLFCQSRIGYGGQPFQCYKFRSMKEKGGAEPTSEEEALQSAKTIINDPRITRLGRFLRKTRIDELPQIFNILKGEMSWIGPRPEASVLSEWYEEKLPFYSYRHVVRPGISGWAQVNQGHVVEVGDVHEKLQYDFYYIKKFSLWLDISIVFLTIKTIITGGGAK